jgi:LDH2 family malate/lactate/ureidoglycolate dehydrogenase
MSERRDETFGGRKHRQNAAMLAIDVTAFGELGAFRAAVDATVGAIKAMPAAGENAEILLPAKEERAHLSSARAKAFPFRQRRGKHWSRRRRRSERPSTAEKGAGHAHHAD